MLEKQGLLTGCNEFVKSAMQSTTAQNGSHCRCERVFILPRLSYLINSHNSLCFVYSFLSLGPSYLFTYECFFHLMAATLT